MNFLSLPPHLRGVLVKAGFVCLTLVAATLLYLWQHVVMVDLGYQVERARERLAALQHREGELLVEAASLSSLDRIERIASERLGMGAPAPDQLVRVIEGPAPADRFAATAPGRDAQMDAPIDAPIVLAAGAAP
jgi:cell division protein FtsL